MLFGVTPTADVKYPLSFLQTVTKTYGMIWGELEGPLSLPLNEPESTLITAGFDISKFIVNLQQQPSAIDIQFALTNYPDINYFQIMNEPEGCSPGQGCLTPQQGFDAVMTAYPLIKKSKPNSTVMAPAVTIFYSSAGVTILNPTSVNWAKEFMTLGAGKYFDDAAIHVYPGGDVYQNSANTATVSAGIDELYSILGNKPMYITETGYQSGNDPQVQANNLQALYDIYLSKNYLIGAYWYRMTDYGQPGTTLGLFDSSFAPKPAATTYKNLISKSIPTFAVQVNT